MISYGKSKLNVNIPTKKVIGTLLPHEARSLSNIKTAVRKSLVSPFQSKPLTEMLKGKKSVLIITVDNTRPSPSALIEPVLDLCQKQKVKTTLIIAILFHIIPTIIILYYTIF